MTDPTLSGAHAVWLHDLTRRPCTPTTPAPATTIIEGRHTHPDGTPGPVLLTLAVCDNPRCHTRARATIVASGLDRRPTTPPWPALCGDTDDRRGLIDPDTGVPLPPQQRRPLHDAPTQPVSGGAVSGRPVRITP